MRALGVDRVGGGFVLALLETAGRTPRVVGTWVVALDPEHSAATTLHDAIDEHVDPAPDAVATSLDESLVTHRLLHLPFTEPARLGATVPFELESLVPFDVEDAVTTFSVLAKDQGSHVLAALAPRDSVASHLEELAEAGVDPAVVDVGGVALAGLVRSACSDALVVEPRAGGVVALLRGGELEGLHVLSGQEPAELAREARWLALALVADGESPGVVMVGAPDDDLGVADALHAATIPLREALPPWAAAVEPGCLRAVALAARAADLLPTGVNFRTGDFVYHAPSEEARRQLRATAIVGAATAFLGLVSYGVVVAERGAELDALRQEIRETVQPIVAGAPPGQERIRLEGAVQSLEKRREMLGGASASRPPVLDVLKLIEKAVPVSTPFEIEELSIDGEGVRFRARTDSYESVDLIKRSLHSLPGAVEPDVRDVKKGIDDRIEFRASIEFRQDDVG